MRILRHNKLDNNIHLETSKGIIKLEPYSDSIIRIVYTREKKFSTKESLMIAHGKRQAIDWDIHENAKEIRLSTEKVTISVLKETGAFRYYDKEGNLLTKEPDIGGKSLAPIDVKKPIFDENTKVKRAQGADGIRVLVDNFNTVVDRGAWHSKLEFEWTDDEALYGLGSHEEGIMNLRGHHRYLYQQNMKAVVPMLVSTSGYGILMDNYSLMVFRDDIYGSYIWMDVADEMDYYFIYGPDFDEITKGYRFLTGQTPMLPRWAFGYAQSKERYQSEDELISVINEYRERNIPLDLIILDWKSWPGDLWGQKTFDPERFPNPRDMTKTIHRKNARLMVSIWPIMATGGTNHGEMAKMGYLLENQSTYDAFDKKARECYWKHANDGLFSKGVDAWWCDCTEPFEADWIGEVKPEPEQRLTINTNEAKKYLDPEYINAYSLLHSKGIYEGQRETTNEKRVVNLTRSAYAGQHRYATITWSGDVSANWATLRNQIAEGLNFCVTGEPYWTSDIGGFFVKKQQDLWFWDGHYDEGCEDLGYREIYLRWFQYGAFLPFFRSHGTDTPREVWRFGEKGTVFYDTLVKFIELRYRLIPYIYSLVGRVTHEDYTFMRLLAFDFRNDSHTYNISDQYMFGPAFMVNPVTKPMYYESGSQKLDQVPKTREVYLPDGHDWYDFWTGERYTGGQTIEADAPLEIMPLYVKAGSVVPMGPIIQYANQETQDPIELRIYRGSDAEFTIYEDEGDNYNYEKGKYSFFSIEWDNKTQQLSIGKRKGKYRGMLDQITFKVVLVAEGHGIGQKDTSDYEKLIKYTGTENLCVKIQT